MRLIPSSFTSHDAVLLISSQLGRGKVVVGLDVVLGFRKVLVGRNEVVVAFDELPCSLETERAPEGAAVVDTSEVVS